MAYFCLIKDHKYKELSAPPTKPAVVRPPHAKGNASTARALRVLKTGSPLAFPETLIHVCFLVKDTL